MKWSFRIARVAGINIKVHVTFFLIVVLFGASWSSTYGPTGFLFGSLLILTLFACVTLHELGHSLAAQAFGIPVREIVLLPLGGVAFLGRNTTRPVQELVIALCGPLVNVILAAGLFVVLLTTGSFGMLNGSSLVQGIAAPPSFTTLLIWLFEANIILALFNMIPAFPLDGGRVLRGVLWMWMGFRNATRTASLIGQGFAIVLGIVAFISVDLFLGLIALFIYFAAGQETRQEDSSAVLRSQRVGEAYNKHALTLSLGDRVSTVFDYVLTSYQPDFAVVQGDRLLGIVTRDDALEALSKAPQGTRVLDTYVTTIMQREVFRVDAADSLEDVRQAMVEQGVRVVAVYDEDMFLGLINRDDIAEAFKVLALREQYQRNNPPSDTPDKRAIPPETSTS